MRTTNPSMFLPGGIAPGEALAGRLGTALGVCIYLSLQPPVQSGACAPAGRPWNWALLLPHTILTATRLEAAGGVGCNARIELCKS